MFILGTELGAESTDGTTEKLPSLDDDEKEVGAIILILSIATREN